MNLNTSRVQRTAACTTVVLTLTLTACGGDANKDSGESTSRPTAAVGTPASTQSGRGLPQGDDPVDLDPADFTAGSDNRYFPLEPRRQWIYQTRPTRPERR